MAKEDPARLARTESLFREVNERIAETAAQFGADDVAFVCECGDPACTHRVAAPLDEYEHVRSSPTTFMLREGHEDSRVETVIERQDDGVVVARKTEPSAARVARELDPRADED